MNLITGLAKTTIGSSSISQYLFYPQQNHKKKTKKTKQNVFHAITGPQWRAQQEEQIKIKAEIEEKKAQNKLIREAKTKVKKEMSENLSKVKKLKVAVQQELNELQLKIAKSTAELKLFQIQNNNSEPLLLEKIEILKKNIAADSLKKSELKTKKINYLNEEREIKSQSDRALKNVNK